MLGVTNTIGRSPIPSTCIVASASGWPDLPRAWHEQSKQKLRRHSPGTKPRCRAGRLRATLGQKDSGGVPSFQITSSCCQ